MTSPSAFVESVDLDALARDEAAWRELSARAAEPNAFAEPDFLLPALRHQALRRVVVARIWVDARRSRLIGLAAVAPPRFGVGLATVWRSEQAALSALVFDADALDTALGALIAWVAKRWRGVSGLMIPFTPSEQATASAIRILASREGRRLVEISPRRRAALEIGGPRRFETELDSKRRKEWARQFRRLAERGELTSDIGGAEGIEGFLALEARGWKGARGTSLNADPARLAFAREVLSAFAARGALQIHRLALDGEPVAMGVVLIVGKRGFYWKTAYDEAFADYSPGVQLTLSLSRALSQSGDLTLLDSCALADHPMIDKVWSRKIALAEFVVASKSGSGRGLSFWLGAQGLVSRAREFVKRRVNAARGRKRS